MIAEILLWVLTILVVVLAVVVSKTVICSKITV